MKRKLLEKMQEACEIITKGYKRQINNDSVQFCVIQLLNMGMIEKTDLVRELAQIYDEYVGNEEYIHIPDVNQMLHNLQHYPVLGVFNTRTGELDGVVTIKYHENSSEETTDPYYPKKGAKFFSITGVIVRQRENTLNKGLGSSLYAASILGVQKYASELTNENIELNAVIDCTNIQSLYALANANRKIYLANYMGEKQKLEAILDGIYTVRNEEQHLVEAPTYVIKIPLVPQKVVDNEGENELFSYKTKSDTPNFEQYQELLDTILAKAKQTRNFNITRTLDDGVGNVDYFHLDNLGIHLENMKIERNGTENIGKKRIPRGDVSEFVGPMPDFQNYIEEEDER